MASINFPSSPADGETFTYSGKTFQWSSANGIWVRKPNGPIPIVPEIVSPTLSGPSSATEGQTIEFTITNYVSSYTYNASVSGGSVYITGNTITWKLPNVTQDNNELLTVRAISDSENLISDIGSKSVFVAFLDIVDTAINISNFSNNNANIGWDL